MSVDLSPDVLNEIQRQVATGTFATPDDVLREALAALRVREETLKHQRDEVRVALDEATEDLKAGRFRPAAEVSRDMRRKFNLPE
jgi:Arc/MetJ-type ribon-helix-helix transcriptional regulator